MELLIYIISSIFLSLLFVAMFGIFISIFGEYIQSKTDNIRWHLYLKSKKYVIQKLIGCEKNKNHFKSQWYEKYFE